YRARGDARGAAGQLHAGIAGARGGEEPTVPDARSWRRLMFVTKKTLPRRTFLRAMGTTIAWPFLDAMVPALSARAFKPTPRFGFVYIANGVIQNLWTPATT